MKRFLFFFLVFNFLGGAVFPAPDSAALIPLQDKLLQGDRLVQSDQVMKKVSEFWEEISPNFQATLWESAVSAVSADLLQFRQSAVEQALQTFQIPKDVAFHISLDSPDDWTIASSGEVTIGNSAFQSPGWLGVALTAIQELSSVRNHWPGAAQEQHHVLAALYQKIFSSSEGWQLTTEESARLEELARFHEQSLEPGSTIVAVQGSSNSPKNQTNAAFPNGATLYVPPVLFPTEPFAVVGLFHGNKPVADIPIGVGRELESGFVLDQIQKTDANGNARIAIAPDQKSVLVFVEGESGPFPERIPILSSVNRPQAAPSSLTSPKILELNTEEIFPGENLISDFGDTTVTMGYRSLPLLASSASFLLTRIPAGPLAPMELSIQTPQNHYEFQTSVFTIWSSLPNQTIHPGETAGLRLEEIGVPEVSAQISVNSPAVVFDDGTLRKFLSLEERKRIELPLKGVAPGPFQIALGLKRPANENAIAALEAMKSSLQGEEEKAVADQAVWALEEDHLGEAFSLLEKLRYTTLVSEGKFLPMETVLQALAASPAATPEASK